MPQFRITDSVSGKTVTVSGDSAPSNQEAEQIFSDAGLHPTQSAQPQPAAPQGESLGQSLGKYAGGIEQGLYRIPQSVVELGARGLDATGLTTKARDTVHSLFEAGNRISNPDQESKYTKTGDKVGQVLGTAPLGGLRVAEGAGMVPSIINGMGQGMAAGALTSSASDAPLTEQIATGGLAGGAGGAVGNIVGKGVTKLTGKTAPAPTTAELRTTAKAAYDEAKDAGVIISKDSFKGAASKIRDQAIEDGLDPVLTPMANRAVERLNEVDDHITLEGVERLRRVIGMAAGSANRDDRRIAGDMKEALDDYVSNITPNDVLGGDTTKVAALQEARGAWSKMSKGELVDDLVNRAGTRAGQFTGSGFENAVRTEFRQLALNPKKMRGFSAEEKDAVKKVAQGGPVGNVLRWAGKFAPRGVVSAAAGQMLGNAIAGPAGGYAAMAAGEAGRFGATASTMKNATMASELMRRGGQPAVTHSPRALALAEALKRLPAPAAGVLAQ